MSLSILKILKSIIFNLSTKNIKFFMESFLFLGSFFFHRGHFFFAHHCIKIFPVHSIYKSGHYYVGEFKYNIKNGQGTMYYTNGTKYVGEWINDKYHGKGTEYSANGQIFREGVWAKHKFVGSG